MEISELTMLVHR